MLCDCRHLGSQLAELENAIEKMMEADLVEFAMQDVQYRLEMCRDESLANEASESEVCVILIIIHSVVQYRKTSYVHQK